MFNLKTGYFPDGASDKESTCQSRRNKTHGFYTCVGKISWSGAGNTLQCSCIENPMDRGAWQTPRVTKSQTLLKPLSVHCLIDLNILMCIFIF